MRKKDKFIAIKKANLVLEEFFLNEKPIGFKVTGDNRDIETGSVRDTLGYKNTTNTEVDWKKMGFDSEEEYKKFLDTKMKDLINKIIGDPELLAVFKRLNDK